MNKNSVRTHFRHVNSQRIKWHFTRESKFHGLCESATDQKPRLHRIGGNRLHLLDRRMFQLTQHGRRSSRELAGASIARTLRKFRAQPDCSRAQTRSLDKPWLESVSPAVTPVNQFSVELCQEQGPLDVWFAVEDIWRRLDVYCSATVSIRDDCAEVTFLSAGAQDWEQDALVLIDRAQERDSYRWQQGAHQGDLVQSIDTRGKDLVIGLTSMVQISRWPEGQEIVCLLKSYLMQVVNPLTFTKSCHASTQTFISNNKQGQPE